MVHVMSCCSNSCCQTSVKLPATFTFQCTTCAQEHRAAATQDSGLHTRHVAFQQTRPQSCRLHIMDSQSEMYSSETAKDVKHRRWAVVINWMTYYISQGRAETPIRRGGQFCCKFTSASRCQNYHNEMPFDKVIVKIKGCNFLPHSV